LQLPDYLDVVGRRKVLIAAVLLAAIGAAIGFLQLLPAKYTATGLLHVEPGAALVGGAVRADDITYLANLENTYSKLAKNPQLAERVAQDLDLASRPQVSVDGVPNTELMEVRATTNSPVTAARSANRFAALLLAEVRGLTRTSSQAAAGAFNRRTQELETAIAKDEAELATLEASPGGEASHLLRVAKLREEISGKRSSLAAQRSDFESFQLALASRSSALSLVTPAAQPSKPSNRHYVLVLLLAVALGLLGGVGLAFLAEGLTRRFRTPTEIEDTLQLPILATVPTVRGATAGAVFNSGSQAEEAFRRLATALLAPRQADDPARTVLVTSARPGEGTSTVVANLGRSLAQAGRSVLLVDANLRSPVLHDVFSLENTSGLSDMLVDTRPQNGDLSAPTTVPGLRLFAAGSPHLDPAMLLGSHHMETWIEAYRSRFDYILFDSPAVLAATDALPLARMADAVLLVARPDVPRESLILADRELAQMNGRPIGLIVNEAARKGAQYHYRERAAHQKAGGARE